MVNPNQGWFGDTVTGSYVPGVGKTCCANHEAWLVVRFEIDCLYPRCRDCLVRRERSRCKSGKRSHDGLSEGCRRVRIIARKRTGSGATTAGAKRGVVLSG